MKKAYLNFLILASILFSSCLSTKTFLKNDQIPNDFGKGNKEIVIITTDLPQKRLAKKIDEAVLDAFEKYYKGPYSYIDGKKKTSEVGYTFYTYSNYTPGTFIGKERMAPTTDYYFGVTDLETKKTYKMNNMGNYKKLSKLYVQALEIVRKRNNSN